MGLPDLALNQNSIYVRPAVLTDDFCGIWLPLAKLKPFAWWC